ncbi:MAG: RNA-binding S4 domain-containing protein [Aestuariivita sp.]|nr:RNA-binding S4 domain-containing protein [Aestuariivita sp.]
MEKSTDKIRLDKWLWYARFFKSRQLSTKMVLARKVRVNAITIKKPGRSVAIGDILTFSQNDDIRVIRIKTLGIRRGPASEARTLYYDLLTNIEKSVNKPSFE